MPPKAPSSVVPDKRLLASKEQSLFRELLNHYETRNLKKGLKTADQILKKHPEHGETTCMKGLILTSMGRREEGVDLVKKGVRLDLTSHICWHVFGLIQKGEKNYEEALKSYTQALRFDKENMNILRDAAHLQTQLRHFDNLVDTRSLILRLRPTLRQNWLSLAVAHHFNGNLQSAKEVLEEYEKMLKDIPDYDFEYSEVLLYHLRILEELELWSEALSLLDVSAKNRTIVDGTAILEIRARLLFKTGAKGEAEGVWRVLIEQNSECYDYYKAFFLNKGIKLDAVTDENREETLKLLHGFTAALPLSTAPLRLSLTVASETEFKELAGPYISRRLSRGVPSLFADLKDLYAISFKRDAIEEIVEQIRQTTDPSNPTKTDQPPTTYLWTLYFLAQHHSQIGAHTKALEILDTAIEHTPTLPELYMCRGRVLKRLGDALGAAHALEDARRLDGQDRFLNTKAAKYRLRAGLIDEAQELFGMFTKKGASSPGADLQDMQSLLYLIEEGNAQTRADRLGPALKKYIAVDKVFDEYDDDQYDFHSYSIRRFIVNVYLSLVTWEDKLRSHPAYVAAILAASRIWIRVHDAPSLASAASVNASMTDAEKKAKKKANKNQKKQDDKKGPANSNKGDDDKGLEAAEVKDDDPDGLKLLTVTDPLEQAVKRVTPLLKLVPDNVDVWLVHYDLAIRRKKYLQAVKALNKARALEPENPELHYRLIELRHTLDGLAQAPPEPIGTAVLAATTTLIPEGVSLETYNSQFQQQHSNSAKASLSAARTSKLLGAPREEVESVAFGVLDPESDLDIRTALQFIDFLQTFQSPRIDEFQTSCAGRFKSSTLFLLPATLATMHKTWQQNGQPNEHSDLTAVLS